MVNSCVYQYLSCRIGSQKRNNSKLLVLPFNSVNSTARSLINYFLVGFVKTIIPNHTAKIKYTIVAIQ